MFLKVVYREESQLNFKVTIFIKNICYWLRYRIWKLKGVSTNTLDWYRTNKTINTKASFFSLNLKAMLCTFEKIWRNLEMVIIHVLTLQQTWETEWKFVSGSPVSIITSDYFNWYKQVMLWLFMRLLTK